MSGYSPATPRSRCRVSSSINDDMRYAPACTADNRVSDGQLVCTVTDDRNVGAVEVSHVVCARTKADGTSASHDEWFVRTSRGLAVRSIAYRARHRRAATFESIHRGAPCERRDQGEARSRRRE